MKRRKFLIESTLALAGILLAPAFGFAESNILEGVVIPLPEAENHIRHGSFDLSEPSGITLPNGVKNVRFQRFFKNGISDSPDDLCLVTFEYEQQEVTIHFKFSELCDKGYLRCEEKTNNSTMHIFTLI